MSRFNLHEYQNKMIEDVRQAYRNGFKYPCVVAPCGAGKSVVISEIARMTTNNGKNILFLVHRKELIDQIKNTFIKNGVDIEYVTFGMVQTVINKLDKIPYPSLIITDENHHAKANTYKKIYEHFSDVLRIGFTATPIRLNGEGLKEVNDILIPSVSVQWLIDNQFLAPFDYYTFENIDTTKLKKNKTGEYSNKSIDKALGKKIYGNVLKNYLEKGNDGQAIVYCHSIEFSKSIVDMFNNHGLVAKHIDAKTNKKERDQIIQDFREKKIRILSNVDLIGEGFDVPDCNVVIMLRPTKSLSLFIQQSMRGMRYKPNKKSIILDHVCNCLEHGLPSTQREWSLEGRKKKSKTDDFDKIEIRICQKCYATNLKENLECQICGHKFETETRNNNLKQDNKAQLRKVTDADFLLVMDFRKPEDCKSLKELQELAKNKGYKSGWAWYQAKMMNLIK